jgi:hypothetical protein
MSVLTDFYRKAQTDNALKAELEATNRKFAEKEAGKC